MLHHPSSATKLVILWIPSDLRWQSWKNSNNDSRVRFIKFMNFSVHLRSPLAEIKKSHNWILKKLYLICSNKMIRIMQNCRKCDILIFHHVIPRWKIFIFRKRFDWRRNRCCQWNSSRKYVKYDFSTVKFAKIQYFIFANRDILLTSKSKIIFLIQPLVAPVLT